LSLGSVLHGTKRKTYSHTKKIVFSGEEIVSLGARNTKITIQKRKEYINDEISL